MEAANTIAARNQKPVPNTRMNNGTSEATEVTTNMESHGWSSASQTRERPMATPSGIPIRQANPYPTIIWRSEIASSRNICPSRSRVTYSGSTTDGGAKRSAPIARPTTSHTVSATPMPSK